MRAPACVCACMVGGWVNGWVGGWVGAVHRWWEKKFVPASPRTAAAEIHISTWLAHFEREAVVQHRDASRQVPHHHVHVVHVEQGTRQGVTRKIPETDCQRSTNHQFCQPVVPQLASGTHIRINIEYVENHLNHQKGGS